MKDHLFDKTKITKEIQKLGKYSETTEQIKICACIAQEKSYNDINEGHAEAEERKINTWRTQ